jgi:serine/threonine-protein kinase
VLDGRYRIVRPIAEGAMGVVCRGERVGLGREVAIKVMHEALPGELAARERFEREAQLMAKLAHPHCVSVIDFGVHDGRPYLVMELVRGHSLHDVIEAERRLSARRAGDIARQVLAGLAHAHELGIVHRDIKPANIMVAPKEALGDHVQILDFGLARMLEQSTQLTKGLAVGTPSYMAPEQCRGAPADARIDLYASGIVLFEMITGKKPFAAVDPMAVVKMQLDQPPPRLADALPGDHGELETVIARALAKSPDQRYQSAVEMAQAIEAALDVPVVGSSVILAVEEPSGVRAQEPMLEPSSVRPRSVRAATPPPPPPPPPAASRRTPAAGEPVASKRASGGARLPAADPHEASMLRRMLPASRMKWVALFLLVLAAAGIYGIVRAKQYLSDKATDPPKATRKAR